MRGRRRRAASPGAWSLRIRDTSFPHRREPSDCATISIASSRRAGQSLFQHFEWSLNSRRRPLSPDPSPAEYRGEGGNAPVGQMFARMMLHPPSHGRELFGGRWGCSRTAVAEVVRLRSCLKSHDFSYELGVRKLKAILTRAADGVKAWVDADGYKQWVAARAKKLKAAIERER